MSYDMIFWRELKPVGEPQSVYERVLADEDVEGLAPLPLAEVKRRFKEHFPAILDEGPQMIWEGDDGYFELSWPPAPVNVLIVTCGWDLVDVPEVMNRIIETATSFGCALYDPQTGQRFEQTDPKPG